MKKLKKIIGRRKCVDCAVERPASKYYGYYYRRCKKCHSAYVMKNQLGRAEYYSEYRRKYEDTNPEKVKAWTANYERRWEEKNGRPYNEYKEKRRREREQTPAYKKMDSERKAIRKAMLYKQRLLIAKQMLRYWQRRVNKLIELKKRKS